MRERVIRVSKISISIILLLLILRQIDLIEFKSVLKHTSIYSVFIVVMAYSASVVINAIKWKVLLPNVEISFLIDLSFRAQLYSTVLPGQLFGEASKVTAWTKRNENISTIAASVIFDKITGIFGQIIICICGLYISKNTTNISNKWTIIAVLIIGIGLIYLSTESHMSAHIGNSVMALRKVNYKLATKLGELYEAWSLFSSNRSILCKSISWGIVNQMLAISSVWYMSSQMKLAVSFVDFCWIIPLMSVILLLPISFAGIGLRDTSLASFLLLFNVSASNSFVISLSLLLGQLVAAGIGAIYVLNNNFRMKQEKYEI